jgi:hypothetical protein
MFALTVTISALSLLAGADDRSVAPARVAVMPFMVEGLALDEASAIEATVRSSCVDAAQAGVLPEGRTQELLRAAGTLGISCDRRTPSCISELGALLGVESVVTGRMAASASGTTLSLTVVDVNARMAVREVEVSLPLGLERQAVEAAVFRLFQDPMTRLGGLVIEADPDVEIFVDGVSVGIAPLSEPVTGVSVGQHTVEARKNGNPVKAATIRVGPGQVHQVSLVDDDTISRDVVRTAGRTLLYGGGAALGVGIVGLLTAIVPFVAGWALFAAIESPVPLDDRTPVRRMQLYSVYSVLYDWQPVGMAATVVALGLTFIGVGLAIGGGSTLLMLGPDEEALIDFKEPRFPMPVSPLAPKPVDDESGG